MAILSNYADQASNVQTMKATILPAAAFLFVATVYLESSPADPPTRAAYNAADQAKRIVSQYDQLIKGAENEIREMRGFKSRFDPSINKPTRQHRPKQYWFRSVQHKRQAIASAEASLAAMRATRWDSAVPANPEAMWSELRVGELAVPTDYSTDKPERIRATVLTEPDASGRVELELAWPEYFAVGDVDCRRIFLDGSDLKRAESLLMPLIWVKSLTDTPDGKRFVCEFATSEQAEALEREISRLTHPDRRPRSWADSSGTHKIDATLTAYDQKTGIVTLERADRTEITLPIAKLSPADRELVELTLGSRINPRPALELGPRDPD